DPAAHRLPPRGLSRGRRRQARCPPRQRPPHGLHRVRRRLRDREDAPAARGAGHDPRRVGHPPPLRRDRGGREVARQGLHLRRAGDDGRRARSAHRLREDRAHREVLPALLSAAPGPTAGSRRRGDQSSVMAREASAAAAIAAATPLRTPSRSRAARSWTVVPPGLETAFFATAGWVPSSVSIVAAPRTVCCTRAAARSRFSPRRTASSVIASMSRNTKAEREPAAPMKAWTWSSVMSTATPAFENRAWARRWWAGSTSAPPMR